MNLKTTYTLNNDVNIPCLGLGVFKARSGKETEQAVLEALRIGYRHLDTAKTYGNEASVGAALRASGVPRGEVWITTKLWNSDHGYESTLRACEASRRALGLDVIDLYLVHWPVPELRRDTWRAMERLLADGHVRAIGVSNYMTRHLDELAAEAGVLPAVNQIELSPYNYEFRRPVVDRCRHLGIAVEAYSPLTKGLKLGDPRLLDLAVEYQKSPAQILIRWCLQMEFIVLPKSTTPARIAENADVFDFSISEEHMALLESFNEDLVTGWDPTEAP